MPTHLSTLTHLCYCTYDNLLSLPSSKGNISHREFCIDQSLAFGLTKSERRILTTPQEHIHLLVTISH